jgi:hypothetical protein
MHNSFTVSEDAGKYVAVSHNFEVIGEGASEYEAITTMSRKIIYIRDNDPKTFERNIRDRIAQGLECKCGHKLEEPPLGVYGGPKIKIHSGSK